LIVLVLVLGIMLVLFTHTGITERADHYLLDNARNPVVAVYTVFFVLVLGRGQVAIAMGCWRYARVARDDWLRRGLRLASAGSVAGMGYSATRLANVAGVLAGYDVAGIEVLVPVCAGLATILTVIGLALPVIGPHVARLIGDYRAYRALAVLWRALYAASPEIALNPPSRRIRDLLQVGDLSYRLYRRVIEIHDARLTLRRWIGSADVCAAREGARGLSGAAVEATVEALLLRAALAAKDAGRLPDDPAPAQIGTRDHDDLAAEIAWLRRVAAAFEQRPQTRGKLRL
jgi:hypothetical protein